MRLLIYNPTSFGGLADYAHAQASALAALGVEAHMLVTTSDKLAEASNYQRHPILFDPPQSKSLLGKFQRVQVMLRNYRLLAAWIHRHQEQKVLFGAFAEYFSPIWSGAFNRLAANGVHFAAIVHDPARDFVLGPLPWHRYSINKAYEFLSDVFVHQDVTLDTAGPVKDLRVHTIPHGVYEFPFSGLEREEARKRLNLPAEATAMLAFGHIRDGKNLDLVIRALAKCPQFYLLIAGKEQSSAQRPASYYIDLAKRLGVYERCRFDVRRIPKDEVGTYFNAADLSVMPYNGQFRSASGVLSASAFFRKPCLVSSGPSNLRSVVEQYELGRWIEPDNLNALIGALQSWHDLAPKPQWSAFLRHNSWHENASRVAQALQLQQLVQK